LEFRRVLFRSRAACHRRRWHAARRRPAALRFRGSVLPRGWTFSSSRKCAGHIRVVRVPGMSVSSHDFSLNPRPAARLSRLGREGEPLLCLDGLMRAPEALIDYAATETGFAPVHGPQGGYPGIRAPAPLDYVEAVVRALDPAVRDAFELGAVRLGRAECNFSLVTLAPGTLLPSQRAPHIDTTDPLQFAFLHY